MKFSYSCCTLAIFIVIIWFYSQIPAFKHHHIPTNLNQVWGLWNLRSDKLCKLKWHYACGNAVSVCGIRPASPFGCFKKYGKMLISCSNWWTSFIYCDEKEKAWSILLPGKIGNCFLIDRTLYKEFYSFFIPAHWTLSSGIAQDYNMKQLKIAIWWLPVNYSDGPDMPSGFKRVHPGLMTSLWPFWN